MAYTYNYEDAIKTTYELKYRPVVFNREENAISYAAHSVKPAWIVLGSVGQYWVVCPADAARLERAGYELLK